MVQYNGEIIFVNLLVDNKCGCLDEGFEFSEGYLRNERVLEGLAVGEQKGMRQAL